MAAEEDAGARLDLVKLTIEKRNDGVCIFSTGLESPCNGIEDIENGQSLVVDFTRYSRTLSRKVFFQSLKEQGLADGLIGIAPLRTFNEWSISFNSQEAKELFHEKEEICIDGLFGEIRECGTNVIHGKVYWLPVQFPQDRLEAVLGYFGKLKRLSRDIAHEDGCGDIFNGLRSFTLQLADDFKPEDLPHKCLIDKQECLIKIAERPSQCFRCALPGHDARFCPSNPPRKNYKQAKKSVEEVLRPFNYTEKKVEKQPSALGSFPTPGNANSKPIESPPATSQNQTAQPKDIAKVARSAERPPSPKRSKPSSSWADQMEELDDISDAESVASTWSTDSKRAAYKKIPEVVELRTAKDRYMSIVESFDAGKHTKALRDFGKDLTPSKAMTPLVPPFFTEVMAFQEVPEHIISHALRDAGEMVNTKFLKLKRTYRNIRDAAQTSKSKRNSK